MSAPAGHQNDLTNALPPSGGASLAARIVTAPFTVDPEAAKVRLKAWLNGLPEGEGRTLRALLTAHSIVEDLLASLADHSPFLWDLVRASPQRLEAFGRCRHQVPQEWRAFRQTRQKGLDHRMRAQ